MSNILPSREVMITIGIILSVVLMLLMVILEHKFTVRALVVAVMSVLAVLPGGIFGELVRKLTYGEWNSITKGISQYEGTHYLGRAIFIICAGLLLWKLIMRKKTDTFAKEGQGRFMDMLSIIMLIQIVAGRLGCLSTGCCWGKIYYGNFAIYNADLGCKVYPAVHTELILSVITFAIVILLYIKRKNAFSAFCIGYSIALFIAEFMYDSTGTIKIFGLSVIQLLSVGVLITGFVFGRRIVANIKIAGNKLPQKRRKSL